MKRILSSGILILLIANLAMAQQSELLTNPDFTNGSNGWWAYGANITNSNGEVHFDIGNVGANAWDIQLGQGNITLRQGYKYTLCWKARRERDALSFNVGLGEAPYTFYFGDFPTGFDGSWKENCIEYTHQGADVGGVALTVNMGGSDANASFDYIYLKEEPNNKSEVTFRVDMQQQSVADEGVFISGSFNNWTPAPMQAKGSLYSSTIKLVKGETIAYKFLNGDEWEHFNGDCTSGDNNDRTLFVPENDQTLDIVCFNSCTYCVDSTVFRTNPGAGPVTFYGEMQVNGNRIDGERTSAPVQVKGISLFWSIWGGEKFWNSGAVNTLVDEWDIELIRAPMSVENNQDWDYGYLHPNGRDKQLSFVDKVVKAAIARDIYVIIDYHSHYADKHPEAAVEFFSTVAQKYGQYDHVIFEIYNEPAVASWTEVKPYAQQVINAIRQYSDNLIIVGTEFWSQKVDIASLAPLDDHNTAYVFHFYASGNTAVKEAFQQRIRDGLNNDIALFASEWGNIYAWGEKEGTSDEVSFAEADSWHVLMNEHAISSANWCVYVDRHQHASGLFYHEEGMQGDISFTGENWGDTSTWTASAHYVYDMLKEQAARAPWRKAERQGYSINYHLNGGYNGANPAFYSYNLDEAIELDEAKREGYQFEGWFSNSNFSGSAVRQIDVGNSGDLELFAKWSKPDSIELLNNPHFSLGVYNWYLIGDSDSVAVDEGKITIHGLSNDEGELWSHTLFNTAKIKLKKNHRYILNWKARRASGNIGFIVRTVDPYHAYFFDYPAFNGAWQENTIIYDHTTETVDDVELAIQLGGNTSDVTIDYISLKETEIAVPAEYMITATAEPQEGGTISGAGSYAEGEQAALTATANTAYLFINWMLDGSSVSTDASYTFTVTEDLALTAVFEAEPMMHTVTATVEPAEGGTVTGAGTYTEGEEATLTATANAAYLFVNWILNGSSVSTDASYTFTVTEDLALTAVFEAKSEEYTVTATAEPEEGGTVAGAGTFAEGEEIVLVISPNEGFHFIEWTVDGNSVSTALEYRFLLTQNISVTAMLEESNAVGELNEKRSLSVFPNPFDRFIELNGLPVNEQLWLGIFNSKGQLLWEQKTHARSGIRLDPGSLNAGVYYVKIEGDVTNEVIKLVKTGK